jgi:hypothetical protein
VSFEKPEKEPEMDADGRAVGGSPMNDHELTERIVLIESMMQAGRKSTEYWGWNFLLWGVAYLVAVAWSSFLPQAGGAKLAWPITMIFAALLTVMIARRRGRHQPQTDRSRSLTSIWTAVGCGIFVFAIPVASTGHMEPHAFIAAIEVLLGVAHIACGSTLRWPTQVAVGLVWWAAAIASCFVSERGTAIIFLTATLICNVGFGIYLMIRESRDKARAAAGVQHA